MKDADFQLALSMVTKSNNCKVSFNVPINGNYNSTHRMLIHDCNAALIKELTEAGFSLYVNDGVGMTIAKF